MSFYLNCVQLFSMLSIPRCNVLFLWCPGEAQLWQLSLCVMHWHHSYLAMWVEECTPVMVVCIFTLVGWFPCFLYVHLIFVAPLSLLTGKNWIKSMILTASLFPFMCFGIGFILNTIAIFYGSLAAIPFGTMVVVFVIWAFISFPLALLGTVVGRNWSGAPNNPCRVKTIPRPIPEKKWYLTPSVVSLMGGLLPFGSIFIEMYFVFTSFWNYKVIIANCFWSLKAYLNSTSIMAYYLHPFLQFLIDAMLW